ncbi:MAG: hypothetical protein A2498_07925 [Lentisphaerae bacterium RIFOXYC12_FULL_60_16]|nr:MAG: hypothetical protein A2498_07925 [Lentisphaerae bacterium RIFOXYC12_FULL_60_16]OGV77013.1 MAG: hypothetical protein A2340_15630 [Lentisphaerae bacterium RIFOXYB12_FULL_60_10]
MRHTRFIIISLLITLAAWLVMSWPLPRFAARGIPSSAENTERDHYRAMIPGDHLQFYYHLWLARDTFFGPTAWFHNPYEFNTGNDADRREFSTYYLPFSFAFAVFSLVLPPALAWNLTGWLALWITLAATWAFCRRFQPDPVLSAGAAMLSVLFPYRWMTLMGGSPTGLAMMWVPLALLGLDGMIRDRRRRGAVLAGLSIFLAGWCDAHVQFFTCLAIPPAALLIWWQASGHLWPTRREWSSLVRAGWPFLIFIGLVALQARGVRSGLEDTALASTGRPWREVMGSSPHPDGWFNRRAHGMDAHAYIGWFLPALLVAGLTASTAWYSHPRRRQFLQAAMIIVLHLGLVLLALAAVLPHLPQGERLWAWIIRGFPPFGMIRQSAKILVLAPTLIAWALALDMQPLVPRLRTTTARILPVSLALIFLTADYGKRISPTICLLDTRQLAYEAIADDADARGEKPRAIALPLWPGDSHWTSVNQYYTTLYRIRMLNGYRPTVRRHYFTSVYEPLESLNAGTLLPGQLDRLTAMDIRYLLLHENAFPEKVSPFSVAYTLSRLLEEPRLHFLRQDGPVWAFRIEDRLRMPEHFLPCSYRFPTRSWEAEHLPSSNATIRAEPFTSADRFLRIESGGHCTTRPFAVGGMEDIGFLARIRTPAAGAAAVVTVEGSPTMPTLTLPLPASTGNWVWVRAPIPAFQGFNPARLTLRAGEGILDVDSILLTGMEWDPDQVPDPLVLPAYLFFHAGHTDLARHDVVLNPETDPDDVIIYGPKLPFPAGAYEVTIDFSSDAPAGTLLARVGSRYPTTHMESTPLIAGAPFRQTMIHPANLRLSVDIRYTRKGSLRIRAITLRRTGPAPSNPTPH